jgi:hypothetical protein
MPDQEMSFMAAMRNFFDYRPNQDTKSFYEEIKTLSDTDRAEFAAMLQAEGYKLK